MNLLSDKLDQVERLAKGSKWSRLLHHPFRYAYAQLRSRLFRNREGVIRTANTFFGRSMSLLLPASTDIYLTGGKTHDSEIRLARFLIRNIRKDDQVIDIGAHFGYFTLLMAELAKSGHVYAFEPSQINFRMLKQNATCGNISIYNEAVSGKSGELRFIEFPALYSEANTLYADQYQREAWFHELPHREIIVPCTTIDAFCHSQQLQPRFIKIDVEGAEEDVIRGGLETLRKFHPVIAMEFVCRERSNDRHHRAKDLLYSLGYKSYYIRADAGLEAADDLDTYLDTRKLESDNMLFSIQ